MGRRGIVSALVVLGVDVFILLLVVVLWQRFWMGLPLLLSSFLAIGFLTYLARRAPTEWPRIRQGKKCGRKTAFIIGALVFPVVIVSQGSGVSLGIQAWAVFSFILVFLGFYIRWVVQNLSFQRNERHLLAFALGLLVPILGFGFISQFPIELVLIADIALALLFVNVRRMYAVRENTERDVRGGGLVNSARHTHEEFGTCLT